MTELCINPGATVSSYNLFSILGLYVSIISPYIFYILKWTTSDISEVVHFKI